MGNFAKAITRATLRKYALTTPVHPTQPPNEGPYYEPDEWFARYTAQIVNRGQINGGGAVSRWEDQFTFGGTNKFFNYALFPTIFTEPSKTKGQPGRASPLTYAVCYSAFPLTGTEGPNNQEHLCAYTPRYKEVHLAPDISITERANRPITRDMFRNGNGPKVFIDTALVGGSPNYDESFLQSVLAALNNSFAMSGSFITFIPLAQDTNEYISGRLATPSRARLSGPSAGAAVFAAVSGYMPFYYTGAMKQIMPFERVTTRYTARKRMTDHLKSSEDLADVNKIMKEQEGYSAFDDLERMQNQWSMAEPIGGLLWKFIYCSSQNVPFLFPAQNAMKKSIFQSVLDFAANDPMINYLDINNAVYTMGQAMDGVSILRRLGGDQAAYVLKSTCSGFTMAEFRDLQMCLTNGMLTMGRLHYGPKKAPLGIESQIDYYNIGDKISDNVYSYGTRMKSAVDSTRTTKRANKATYSQWKNSGMSTAEIEKQLKDRKKAKKQTAKKKREANRKLGPKQAQEFKDQVTEEIDNYATKLLALKISEGYYGMDAKQQRRFFDNFPSAQDMKDQIKSLKHKVPIALLKAIINDFLNFHPPSVRKGNGYKLLIARFHKAVKSASETMSLEDARNLVGKILGVTPEKLEVWTQLAQQKDIQNQQQALIADSKQPRRGIVQQDAQPIVEEPDDEDDQVAAPTNMPANNNRAQTPPNNNRAQILQGPLPTLDEFMASVQEDSAARGGAKSMGKGQSKAMAANKKGKKGGASAAGKKSKKNKRELF